MGSIVLALLGVGTIIVIAVIIAGCVKISGRISEEERRKEWKLRQEELKREECPCETCLRWPECNGTDESCPFRR